MGENTDRWSVNLIGETLLGRYRVERTIGAGGMANVYLAEDEQLDIPVVVKVPHTAFLADPGFRERFERETRDLVTLQHPHIVGILARGEHEGLPFLVMQFLKGGSFGDRLRKAKGVPMPWAEIEPWVRDAARALDFIHDQGVVHRDIKPDNVLFDEYGHAFLSDFGIAKAVGGVDTGLTVTGTTPGSPAYMAPEQPRTNALSGASDQYSLAATIYEALTGRPTFEGETAVDVLIQKQSEVPPPVTQHAPDVPPAVSAAITRGLARAPEERFPTCAAMVEAMFASVPEGAPAPDPAPASDAAPAPDPAPAAATPASANPTAIERASPAHAPATTARSDGPAGARSGMAKVYGVGLAVLVAGGLVFFLASRSNDDSALPETPAEHTDAQPPKDEDPGTPPAVDATVGLDRFAGTYELDRVALRTQIGALERAAPKRKGANGRMPPVLRDLVRMMTSGFELTLGKDGRYVASYRTRGNEVQRMSGVWSKEGDLLEFKPEALSPKPDGDALRARPAEGGLYLLRRGHQVFLKRR